MEDNFQDFGEVPFLVKQIQHQPLLVAACSRPPFLLAVICSGCITVFLSYFCIVGDIIPLINYFCMLCIAGNIALIIISYRLCCWRYFLNI